MSLTFQQQLNSLSWMVAAYEERLSLLYKEATPLYAYLDIVFSSEFCGAESSWKKSKQITEAIKNKVRFLLRHGVINPTIIKNALFPYIKRLKVISEKAYDQLNEFISSRNYCGPKCLFKVISLQKDLIGLSKDIGMLVEGFNM